MITDKTEVLHQGDENGNNMIVKMALSTGREIFGFATKNVYSGEWDIGPTWNYLVLSEKPFLLDTGRRGMGPRLLEMLEQVGFNSKDLDSVVLSHGHEDHDGGLAHIVNSCGAKAVAHKVYERLIRTYPKQAPTPKRKTFSASCWHCPMPESFSQKNCLPYHEERDRLQIETIEGSNYEFEEGIVAYHVPGHSPDSLGIFIDGEILLAGDTVLPGITPHPSQEDLFELTKSVFAGQYQAAQQLYGLRAYIQSLGKLKKVGTELGRAILALPAHRLFHNSAWGFMNLQERIEELVEHHVQRCADFLATLDEGSKTPKEIARAYFEEKQLEGSGMNMAINEVLSHCELLKISGDINFEGEGKISRTSSTNFEVLIKELFQ